MPKLYIAGNFTVMNNPREEYLLRKYLGDDYNRLASFFHKKGLMNLIRIERRERVKGWILERRLKNDN